MMGNVYEIIVLCIGYALLFFAIIMLALGFVAETTGHFVDVEPQPEEPMIFDAEYIILENNPSSHNKSLANQTAVL